MSEKTVSVLRILTNSSIHDEFDSNYGQFLVKELTHLEYNVKKYVILSQNENVAQEMDLLFKQYDFVIVIGNLQNEAILKALSKMCGLSDISSKCFINKLNSCEDSTSQIVKLLTTSRKTISPIIHIQGLFIIDEDSVEESFFFILKDYLNRYQLKRMFTKHIEIQMNGETGKILNEIKKFDKTQAFVDENDKLLTLTLKSECFDEIVGCEKFLQRQLQASILSSQELIDFANSIYTDTRNHIIQAIRDVEQCLETYGPENVFLSFNGGKDCTVLLHLIYTVLKHNYPNYKEPVVCLYVTSTNPFEEQDEFIQKCNIYYNLRIIKICGSIKQALNSILGSNSNYKACFMGTRRTDPFSENLHTFQMTDPNWPQIMRVSPLLNWHYSDIWDYLLFYKVPYCKLYDEGYTSLGNAINTKRNPCLTLNYFENDEPTYLPAYKLLNEEKERFGRNA